MDIDTDFRICKRCERVAVVNPSGLCPRCQHQAADSRARVKPCVKCGSVDGRPDPRNGRIKRSRGLCSVCYDAWWEDRRSTRRRLAELVAKPKPEPKTPAENHKKAWAKTEPRGTDWASLRGPDLTRTLKRLWKRRPKSTLRFFAGETTVGD